MKRERRLKDTLKNMAEYEEIQNFTETLVSKQVNNKVMEIKKLREENRKMKIELTAIKNVIKRYMTNGKKFSQKTD
tara:strand:- start:117 stop:344 length:228 start_codon:yes stop_codon:yes gene_type:complete